MKFVPFWGLITLCSSCSCSRLGRRKFPVCKIAGDIDLGLFHGSDFTRLCCLCSALQMLPEINAAALPAPDRQLLGAAASVLVSFSLFSLPGLSV